MAAFFDPAGRPDRGFMIVLSSPSGAGKSTLARLLMETEKERLGLSISVTTRPRRASEIDGVHYRFVSVEEFTRLRDGGELLEWAEGHGNFYGTPRAPVEQQLTAGRDVLFDIDWQGTLQLYAAARSDVVSIFVLPPSAAELRNRLVRRAEDAPEVIAKRLHNARAELGHWVEYDYVIVNDELDRAFSGLRAILAAERLRRERRPSIGAFVERLCTDL